MTVEFGSEQAKRISQRDKLIGSPAWAELKAIYKEIKDLEESIKADRQRIDDLHRNAADVRREHHITVEDEMFYLPKEAR